MHRWSAEIEVAVFETKFFGRLLAVVVGIDGWSGGFVKEGKLIDNEFDGAGFDVGIDEIFSTISHFAGGGEDEFVADGLGELKSILGIRSDDELEDAGVIAEINKDETTVVAAGINPSGDADRFADVIDSFAC